jgi:hypothetical protein
MQKEARELQWTKFEQLRHDVARAVQLRRAGYDGDDRARQLVALLDTLVIRHLEWPDGQWSPAPDMTRDIVFYNGKHAATILCMQVRLSIDTITIGADLGLQVIEAAGQKMHHIYIGSDRLISTMAITPDIVEQFCEKATGKIKELGMAKVMATVPAGEPLQRK